MTLTHARKVTHDPIPAERYTAAMGLVYADIELTNADDAAVAKRGFIRADDVRRIMVNVLVDSGAYTLAINERVRERLGLEIVDSETGSLADGSKITIPIASAVDVRFENRNTIVRPLAPRRRGSPPRSYPDGGHGPRRRPAPPNAARQSAPPGQGRIQGQVVCALARRSCLRYYLRYV